MGYGWLKIHCRLLHLIKSPPLQIDDLRKHVMWLYTSNVVRYFHSSLILLPLRGWHIILQRRVCTVELTLIKYWKILPLFLSKLPSDRIYLASWRLTESKLIHKKPNVFSDPIIGAIFFLTYRMSKRILVCCIKLLKEESILFYWYTIVTRSSPWNHSIYLAKSNNSSHSWPHSVPTECSKKTGVTWLFESYSITSTVVPYDWGPTPCKRAASQ